MHRRRPDWAHAARSRPQSVAKRACRVLSLAMRTRPALQRIDQHPPVLSGGADEGARLASAVAQRTAQLTDLSQYLIRLAEEEKQRLAAELHDELGALHTVIGMELERVLHDLRARAPDLVQRQVTAIGLLHQAIDIKRRIIADLRPVMLHDLGLVATLAGHAEQWSRAAGVRVRLQLPDAFPSLPERVELALFRIAQESLTNVDKYARATEVTIILAIVGNELVLSIVDNGIGVARDTLEQPGSHGILGMRQRIAQCGGELMVTQGPGGIGTAVSVCLDVDLHGEGAGDAVSSDAALRQPKHDSHPAVRPTVVRGAR
jgi:signal transduction histidine kinase